MAERESDEDGDSSIVKSINRFWRAVAVLSKFPVSDGMRGHLDTFASWTRKEDSPEGVFRVELLTGQENVLLLNGRGRLAALRSRAESTIFRVLATRAEIWAIRIFLLALDEASKNSLGWTSSLAQATVEALQWHLADERGVLQSAEQAGLSGMAAVSGVSRVEEHICLGEHSQEFQRRFDPAGPGWCDTASVCSFRQRGLSTLSLLEHLQEEAERIRAGVLFLQQQRTGNGVRQEAEAYEGQLTAIERILAAPEHVLAAAEAISLAFSQMGDEGRPIHQAIQQWLTAEGGLQETWMTIPVYDI